MSCRGVAKVGAVDCDEEAELCQEFDVQSFPTIKLFLAGGRGVEDFEGSKSAKAIHDFALEHVPSEVVNIRTKDHLDSFKVCVREQCVILHSRKCRQRLSKSGRGITWTAFRYVCECDV